MVPFGGWEMPVQYTGIIEGHRAHRGAGAEGRGARRSSRRPRRDRHRLLPLRARQRRRSADPDLADRLHRRGRLRALCAGRPDEAPLEGAPGCGPRRRRRADRARRTRHLAARDEVRPLRQRHRRDHEPARGRARLGRQARQGRVHRSRGAREGPRRGRAAATGRNRDDRQGRRASRLSGEDRRPRRRDRHLGLVRPLGRQVHRDRLRRDGARGRRHRARGGDSRSGQGGPDRAHTVLPVQSENSRVKGEKMANVPKDLKYTREHEWAKQDGDRVRVGITAYAQEQLGDVVFVELPKVGAKVAAMKTFGVVESVKAVSDLFAPLTGEVVEINAELPKKPEVVNADPYGKGWMIVVKLANPKEWETLMSAADYEKLVAAAGH